MSSDGPGPTMALPLPETNGCYLCEIVAGRSDPWNLVEQTGLTVTLLNGRQFELGQCLVLPRRHAPTLLDLTPPEDAAVMAAARRLARAMVNAFAPQGVLLYQNNGTGSGQEIPHFHLHVVPRRPDSDWGLGPPHIARLERQRRPAHLDYTAVTDQKRETVELLRRNFDDR
jgi:histidine triad (HIT) family protein